MHISVGSGLCVFQELLSTLISANRLEEKQLHLILTDMMLFNPYLANVERWAPINANKWQMGFNSAFKGIIPAISENITSNTYTNNQWAWRKFVMLFHMDRGVRSSQISVPHDVCSVTVSNSANDRSKTSLSGSSSAVREGAYHLLDLCKKIRCMYISRTWTQKLLTH